MFEQLPALLLIAAIAATLLLLPYLGQEERQPREERRATEELHIRPKRR